MSTKKTNNAFPELKKSLREIDLPDNPKLLDCFAGDHKMWEGKPLERYYPVDKESYKNLSIQADNLKILKSLDLSKFNVIDLDAYGVPFKQLDIIFNSEFEGTIYFTFIQTMFGKLPNRLLFEFGYTPEMIRKTQTVFNKHGFGKFKNFLAKRGVKKIKYFNPEGTQKYYGVFTINY